MTDKELCEQGIECPAEHYEPDCMSCRASVLIRDMRALRDALPLEAPPA